MKNKLLLGLAFVTVLSANSFAMEIKHGKLLSHKEWTTGNVKAAPQDAKNLKILPLQFPYHQFKNSPDQKDVIQVMDYLSGMGNPINGSQIPINTDVTLYGESSASIWNATPVSATYTITTTLEVCSAPPSGGIGMCQINITGSGVSQDVITLDPQGEVTLGSPVQVVVNFDSPESVMYFTTTSISKDNGSSIFSTGSDTGFFNIVADNKNK